MPKWIALRTGTLGARVHPDVTWHTTIKPQVIDDGLGTRHVEIDPLEHKVVEVLDVEPALAARPDFEDALRARAARLRDIAVPVLTTVHRIDRTDDALHIVADRVEGLRLHELLPAAACSEMPLNPPAALELASRIIRAVASIHQKPGLWHGSIAPEHVVITPNGDIILTDAVFGGALEGLQLNREQLWREFHLAMPTCASIPRFDVRADMTQLGATVLAVVQGRCLRADEYPRHITGVINMTTLEAGPFQPGSPSSRLRMWLHLAMQLHPRENYATVGEAERAFADVIGAGAQRRAGAAAFQAVLRAVYGEPLEPARSQGVERPVTIAATSTPVPPVVPSGQADPARTTRHSRLRSVFPIFRPN